jgi:hypothetical protein
VRCFAERARAAAREETPERSAAALRTRPAASRRSFLPCSASEAGFRRAGPVEAPNVSAGPAREAESFPGPPLRPQVRKERALRAGRKHGLVSPPARPRAARTTSLCVGLAQARSQTYIRREARGAVKARLHDHPGPRARSSSVSSPPAPPRRGCARPSRREKRYFTDPAPIRSSSPAVTGRARPGCPRRRRRAQLQEPSKSPRSNPRFRGWIRLFENAAQKRPSWAFSPRPTACRRFARERGSLLQAPGDESSSRSGKRAGVRLGVFSAQLLKPGGRRSDASPARARPRDGSRALSVKAGQTLRVALPSPAPASSRTRTPEQT